MDGSLVRRAKLPTMAGLMPAFLLRARDATIRLALPSLLALLAAAATVLAAAPFDLPWLAFALPPLFYAALHRRDGTLLGVRDAAFIGVLYGFLVHFGAFYWLVGTMKVFGRLAVGWAFTFGTLHHLGASLPAVLIAIATAWLGRDARRRPFVFVLAFALAFNHAPRLFPFRPTEIVGPILHYVALADVGGTPLMDALFAAAALFVPLGLLRRERGLALAGALLFALPFAYGAYRLPQIEAARADATVARVGLVQPAISIRQKSQRTAARRTLARIQDLAREAEAEGAELTVWPETAYPYPVGRTARRMPRGTGRVHARGVTRPVITGAGVEGERCDRSNSAISISADGEILGVASKQRLLAFGETVPFWSVIPFLQRIFRCPGLVPGAEPEVLPALSTTAGVLNCYEDLIPEQGRIVAGAGARWLVNITNDSWFGDTSEPRLHHMVARLRAIETRRDLVRAVNAGVSGHYSATGEELARTEVGRPTQIVVDVRPIDVETVYVRFGDWASVLWAALLLGLSWPTLRQLRFRRSAATAEAEPDAPSAPKSAEASAPDEDAAEALAEAPAPEPDSTEASEADPLSEDESPRGA